MGRLPLLLYFIAVLPLSLFGQTADEDDIREGNLRRREALEAQEITLPPPKIQEEKKPWGPISFSRKYVEFGFNIRGGFANDLVSPGDLLQKALNINLGEWGNKVRDSGIHLNTALSGDVFLNINMQGTWGVGIFAGVQGGIYGTIPQSIMTFLGEGNRSEESRSPEGDLWVAGGVFADMGLRASYKVMGGKLKLGITPAMYIPIVYIPRSTVHYQLDAGDSLSFTSKIDIQVYSLLNLQDLRITMDSLLEEINRAKGFDFSLYGEYALFSFLDLGAAITHIPLFPASLQYCMGITGDLDIDGSELIKGKSPEMPDTIMTTTYTSEVSYRVFRPLRFDLYARYRPFEQSFNNLVLQPNIGFTVLTAGEEANFNMGLEAQLHLREIFRLHLGTGYEETLWKHRLGFALNLRAFELDFEAGLSSQGFINSFMLQGLSLALGIRLGW